MKKDQKLGDCMTMMQSWVKGLYCAGFECCRDKQSDEMLKVTYIIYIYSCMHNCTHRVKRDWSELQIKLGKEK